MCLHSRKDIKTMHMVHAKLLQETCEQHSHRAVDLSSLHVLFTIIGLKGFPALFFVNYAYICTWIRGHLKNSSLEYHHRT